MDVDLTMGFGNAAGGDPYIYINHMGSKLKTKHISMKKIPDSDVNCKKERFEEVVWNEEMLLPIEVPLSNDELKFQIYDHDTAARDDLVCTMKFSIKELLKTDSSRNEKDEDGNIKKMTYCMKWVNLYGCNKEFTGTMNRSKDSKQMDL